MEQKYRNYMTSQLEALLGIDSPSGYTAAVQCYLASELRALGYEPEVLHKGGVICNLGGEGDPIMLAAHVDTLGAIVSTIKPSGKLAVSRIGGLNANNVETENVRVITRFNGIFEGTFQVPNASVHVNAKVNEPRSFESNLEIVLDEHVTSADDVRALGISVGDFVALDPRFRITPSGYIKSRFLDDKASAAVLLAYAKLLRDEERTPARNTWLNFTVHEEIGHGGAAGIPDCIREMISVDMGCVGEGVTCTERQTSICAKDSGGPYNYDVTTNLIKTAREHGIDYAVDIYNFYGSDVEVTLRAGYDIVHGLIGQGVYASHGYERTHVDGMANTFDLLLHYIG